MVRVILRGGLGNQMFQYAAGLALARKYNRELQIDTTFLNDRFPRKQFTYRTYDLYVFDFSPKFTVLSKISAAIPIPGLWLALDLAFTKVRTMLGGQRLITEKTEYHVDPEVVNAGGNVALWGFWQTPDYFKNIEKEVRNTFRFKNRMEGEAARIAQLISTTNSVSLHVRRGDYVLPKQRTMYGDTSLSYYDRAIEYIAKHVDRPHFFVFSDDIEWCKNNIKIPFEVSYIDRSSEGPGSSYHLELMSLSKHNIIANSTFSWWAAWLNANINKIIIAPKRWHADPHVPDADIIPAGWIRM